MSDRLIIRDLAVDCCLGVPACEREKPQTVWIDLELVIDAAKAAARDDVRDAIDYAQLVTSVKELAQAKPYKLLETLAEQIAALVIGEFGTPSVRVRVRKRALPGIDYAAVEVERSGRQNLAKPSRRLARVRRQLLTPK